MDKNGCDKKIESYLNQVFQAFKEAFITDQNYPPQPILNREAFMNFSVLLYKQTESEKEIKTVMSILKACIWDIIIGSYIPFI